MCLLLVDVGVEVGHLEDLCLDSRIIENGFSRTEMSWTEFELVWPRIGTGGKRFRVP